MNLDQDIQATRTLMNGDTSFVGITKKQTQKLVIAFRNAGVLDRNVRINMLREWTGIMHLESSQNLTLHTASVMINHICLPGGNLDFDGLIFLTKLADRTKSKIAQRQVRDDQPGDVPDMLNVQEADYSTPW